MNSIEQANSITQEIINALGRSEQCFTENGIDFEAELSKWAEEYAGIFSELGSAYPFNGTLPEKLQAITPVFVVNQLRGRIVQIDTILDRLESSGEKLGDEDAEDMAALMQQLDREEKTNPEYRSLIAEVRCKIDQLGKKI
ncbi:hypothetical protein JXD20_00300 [Candidatus Peregrinibacteria bacterium]|nr:hypothetical protein [Candidatus Peregrinibacteria bacterium]